MNKLSKTVIAIAALLMCLALIIFPKQAASGVTNGINICIATIIPTLFPFMVLSQFIVRSGISDKIGKACAPLFKPIFGLPGICAPVVIMGLVGGYPVGTKMATELYKEGKISLTHLKRLICFVVNAGPSFIIATVGTMLLGSYRAGLLMFAATILSSLTVGIFSRFFIKNDEIPTVTNFNRHSSMSESLVSAVNDAAKATLSMCCYILLFCSLTSILEGSGAMKAIVNTVSPLLTKIGIPHSSAEAAIHCLFEVGSGCVQASGSAMLMCWAIGWGGLSVHFQIYSILNRIKISRFTFMISRLICAALNCIYFRILLNLFPVDIEVFSSTMSGISMNMGQILMSLAFALLMLATINKELQRHRGVQKQ